MSKWDFTAESLWNKISYLLRYVAGVDRAVVYSLLAKTWGAMSTPVTIWLITTKFTPEIQGYYFTFNSLLLFQTFLELGFTVVLIQFISHEWAHLSMSSLQKIEGDSTALSRLASLVELGIKWYLVLAVTFFVIVGTGGYYFLAYSHTNVEYQKPWWLLCMAVSLNILLVPIHSFLEGSNRVYLSQQVYLKTSIVSTLLGWLAIYFGAGLYTAAIVSISTALVGFILLFPLFLPYFRLLRHEGAAHYVSWKKEFWPQQWKIGISWISGFFMFQSFVPILFAVRGPVVAGQMGATFQIYNAVNAFAQAWTHAVSPQFGILGARREIAALKQLIKITFLRSLTACIFGVLGALSIIALLRYYNMPQVDRFLDFYSITILLLVLVAMQLSNVETLAVRFQKSEPFVIISVSSAVLVFVSNIIMSQVAGVFYVVCSFGIIMLMYLIPLNHYCYKREMRRLFSV